MPPSQTYRYSFYISEIYIDPLLESITGPLHFYYDIFYIEYRPDFYADSYACLIAKPGDSNEIYASIKFVLNAGIKIIDDRFRDYLIEPLLAFFYKKLMEKGIDIEDYIFVSTESVLQEIKNDPIPFDEFEGYKSWEVLEVIYEFPPGITFERKPLKIRGALGRKRK